MYFILSPLIPVFSFSLVSSSASHVFPSVLAFRNLSTSSLYPSLIIPPSLILIGGSSFIELSINEVISSKTSNSSVISLKRELLKSCITVFICGNIFKELSKAIKSLGLADLYATLLISLSKSYIGERYSLNSSLVIKDLFNSSIAFCLFIIDSLSINGCSI